MLIDSVFHRLIGRNMEVYVDDMVLMSDSFHQHIKDLDEVFSIIQKYNMRLNLEKCVFGVISGMLLGFMLTRCGIEAYLDKYWTLLEMRSPINVK